MLKNNKALGGCNINAEILKGLNCGYFPEMLCYLFN